MKTKTNCKKEASLIQALFFKLKRSFNRTCCFGKPKFEITLVIFFSFEHTAKTTDYAYSKSKISEDLLRFITANKNFFSPYNEGVSLDKTSRTVQFGCVKYCEHFMSV